MPKRPDPHKELKELDYDFRYPETTMIRVTADPLNRHGAVVELGDKRRYLDRLQAQNLATEFISAAEDLLYLADKTHASDACEALRLLLPKLLQRETP
jgi:hypothetical protein